MTYPITKDTLRKLGILLYNVDIWVTKDARFSHSNSKIRDLKEMLYEVRITLGREISEAEKNDVSGEIPGNGRLDRADNVGGNIPPNTENEKP